MKNFIFCLLFVIPVLSFAQQGIIKGTVVNRISNEPIPFANITIQGTTIGVAANENGGYEITGLAPGQYNVQVSFVGFTPMVAYEVQVSNARPAYVNFALDEEAEKLDEVVISASNTFIKSDESPLSLRTIGTTEIKRTPGG